VNIIILNSEQSENIEYIQSLFYTHTVIAFDTYPTIFKRINSQINKPDNYKQRFTMTPLGYLYYFCPSDIDIQNINDLLIDLQSKIK
jgi:hypothetical protein